MLRAVESAVPQRVARQMDRLQSSPERQVLSVVERFIHQRRLITEDPASGGFQTAAPAVDSLIRVNAVDVRLFIRMGKNLRPGPPFEPGQVAGMIEMPVGQ